MSKLFPQPEYTPPISANGIGTYTLYRLRGQYASVLAVYSHSQAATPFIEHNSNRAAYITANWYGMRLV